MNVRKVCWLTPPRFRSSFTTTMLFKKMKAFFLWNKFSHVSKFSNFNLFCFFCWNYRTKNYFAKNTRTEGIQLSNSREWLKLPLNIRSLLTLKSFIPGVFLWIANFALYTSMCQPNSKTENLQSTSDVRLDTFHVICLHLNTDFREMLLLFLTKISEDYRQDHVHPVITLKSEVSFSCALPKMLHSILVAVFLLIARLREFFMCFFCENFHHFYFLKFLENRSLKEFFLGFSEVSAESWHYRQELYLLWFAHFLFSSYGLRWWQKKPNLFFFKLCWNCKLRYKGSGIRRKNFPLIVLRSQRGFSHCKARSRCVEARQLFCPKFSAQEKTNFSDQKCKSFVYGLSPRLFFSKSSI